MDNIEPHKAAPGTTKESTFIDEFLSSAKYSAVQAPIEGLAQISNEVAGTNFKPDLAYRPEPTRVGTPAWYGQQFGAGVGTLPWIVGTSYAVRGGGKLLLRTETAAAVTLRGGLSMSPAAFQLTELGTTGLIMGGVLQPTSPGGDFWTKRRDAALGTAAAFVTMGYVAKAASRTSWLGRSDGATLNTAGLNAAEQSTWRSAFIDRAKTAGQFTVGGVVAGPVDVLTRSALSGRPVEMKDLVESSYATAITGGGLGFFGPRPKGFESAKPTEKMVEKPALASEKVVPLSDKAAVPTVEKVVQGETSTVAGEAKALNEANAVADKTTAPLERAPQANFESVKELQIRNPKTGEVLDVKVEHTVGEKGQPEVRLKTAAGEDVAFLRYEIVDPQPGQKSANFLYGYPERTQQSFLWLDMMRVEDGFQGRGVREALVQELVQESQRLGFEGRVKLQAVNDYNTIAAIPWFKSGFRPQAGSRHHGEALESARRLLDDVARTNRRLTMEEGRELSDILMFLP